MRAFAGRVWAIAAVTLLEARRRRVFLILLLFTAALASSLAFFPSVDPAGRLRVVQTWALQATGLFTAIAALFLAAFSLPSDFDQKRIYLLATKPVAKPAIFLGKFLGFVLMLVILIGCMAAITLAFIRSVQVLSGDGFPAPVTRAGLPARELLGHGAHRGGSEGQLVVIMEKPETDEPSLAWRFADVDPADFDDPIRIETKFVLQAVDDPYRASGRVRLRAMPRAGGAVVHDETRLLNTREETEFLVPARAVDADGNLLVVITALDPDGVLAAEPDWVRLISRPRSFELNYFAGMSLVFLQSLLVLSLTMMASAFLSAPVSILLGILLYVVGSAHGFVGEGIRSIDSSLERMEEGRPSPAVDLPPWTLRVSSFVSGLVLEIIPDFEHFDFSRSLFEDRTLGAGSSARPRRARCPMRSCWRRWGCS